MRGIVIKTSVTERQKPSVNSMVTAAYNFGKIVNVKGSVFGDLVDGEDIWYKLDNDFYLWSGSVELDVDCSFLPEDQRDHYLISYRQRHPDGRPNLDTKEPSKELYFVPVRLPADTESIRADVLNPITFAESIRQAVSKLDDHRKHVFVYIHGYQLFSSLKLDLLSSFVLNYITHPENSIAKVLFLAWPGQGGPSRKTVDDRSVKAGQQFTELGFFSYFEHLAKEIGKEGKTLNLLVHSFGHQLLNGMLNPGGCSSENASKTEKRFNRIFKNIFLMAPDITHLTLQMDGKCLPNYFQDSDGLNFHYQFSRLKELGEHVHVFYDKYDYLLYSSTKKFVGKRNLRRAKDKLAVTQDYRNLGNYGISKLTADMIEPDFNLVNVEELIGRGAPGDLLDFPFQNIKERRAGQLIDRVWDLADYDGINAKHIIFNAGRFPNHHRYLFTCKPVVEEVLRLLKQP